MNAASVHNRTIHPTLRGIFVTGTDTGIGKTVVAAALMHRYRSVARLRYWKPIQTGIDVDDDAREVRRLASCPARHLLTGGVRLPRPVSPHLAARLNGQTIELDPLVDLVRRQNRLDRWIVEGAGGALVPINDTCLMIDLMRRLNLPTVVVARARLGTINHTLLTLEALRARTIMVAGVVMVGRRNPENRAAIEHYGRVAVLGELPRLAPPLPRALRAWADAELDGEHRLSEWFR